MSSFRVKSTSKLIDSNTTVTIGGQTKSFMAMLEADEENEPSFIEYLVQFKNQFSNRPKGDSSGGMVIKEIKSASSDRM